MRETDRRVHSRARTEARGNSAEVRRVEARDAEAAQTLRFIGSPSVRVNGVDIEPDRENDAPFYGCRTYSVGGKTTGVPPEEWLLDALRRPENKKATCCRLA